MRVNHFSLSGYLQNAATSYTFETVSAAVLFSLFPAIRKTGRTGKTEDCYSSVPLASRNSFMIAGKMIKSVPFNPLS
jgi:hypothetical protein